jgi:inner membrane protein
MDPFSQGLLGASASSSFSFLKLRPRLFVMGFLAGLAADSDIFIRSSTDPLFTVTMHRHFTHALFFIPFGAFIVSVLYWALFERRYKKSEAFLLREIFLVSLIAYATHGFLDAATSYGTLLFWPFSYRRIAWDSIAIIDPVFTGLLFVSLLLGFCLKKRGLLQLGFILAVLYLGFGEWQNSKAEVFQKCLAEKRGHSWERGRVFPSLANLLVWRSVYRSGDVWYLDGMRVSPFKKTLIWEGEQVPSVNSEELFTQVSDGSVLQGDLKDFAWFADDYLAYQEEGSREDDVSELLDLRYGFEVDRRAPIWTIRYRLKDENKHVEWIERGENREKALRVLWKRIFLSKNERQKALVLNDCGDIL